MNAIATIQKRSLVDSMAARYDMEPSAFVSAIKATVIKGECSNEQFAAFLMVAKEYDLNPLTKEIYAFPDRGGIQPIVSIDGWMNLINSHPQFDGMEFQDTHDEVGKLYSVECRMFRKDRTRHVSVIEYMSECFRQTDPWKKWPNRMLRHKAAIQCARYAFGFSGIMEPDEYDRMKDVTPVDAPPHTSLQERLASAKEARGEQEGFNAASVARETEALTGGVPEQNTETSADDLPSKADAGSDIDAIAPNERVASAPLADDESALESSGDDVASPSSSLDSEIDDFSEQTTGRNPAVIRELKRECKDKLLQIATSDLPAGERRGVLERTKNVWKDELPEGLEFVRICFETADKVIKKELTPEFALKYLNGLVGAI
ncbi:MAG TPA: RecT family recombinase [Alphaproteobacteria bacterium]|nr:RecT family recombinase [Alphaproteobacteria bacterium]